ncbi:MAG: antibiotic biosynthesis monooxygenase family protein [Chloroflexota bacterium]|nr:MAG: antibiotic biosynthesis monooxygenase [Chloroflexota bacterium]
MSVYSLGIWIVKPGREGDFVEAWREMADWTTREMTGGEKGTLLRDREQPNRFVSFGPWDSVEAITAWRAHPGFRERVGKLREMLDDFSPTTLDDVST